MSMFFYFISLSLCSLCNTSFILLSEKHLEQVLSEVYKLCMCVYLISLNGISNLKHITDY